MHTSAPRSAHPAGTNGPLGIKPKGFRFLGPPMMHFREGFEFLRAWLPHRLISIGIDRQNKNFQVFMLTWLIAFSSVKIMKNEKV